MSTFIKAKVFMLPSNKKAHEGQLVLGSKSSVGAFIASRRSLGNRYFDGDESHWKEYHRTEEGKLSFSPQHLYFTSDEEIKAGDYFINFGQFNHGVYYCLDDIHAENIKHHCKEFKKIIATTDKTLIVDIFAKQSHTDPVKIYLPEPSKEFLEVYVKAYNEGKKIEEVLAEMEDFGEEDWAGDNYTGEPIWRHDWRVKVKPDNTITIKKVKDSWNYEEHCLDMQYYNDWAIVNGY